MSDFDAVTTLTVTPDDPFNNTITAQDGTLLYIVSYERGAGGGESAILSVCDAASGAVIAMTEYRPTASPSKRLTLGNRDPMPLKSWLSKSAIPFRDDVAFKDDSGRRYRWKGTALGQSLQLFTEDDNFRQPIARFYKSTMSSKTDPPSMTPATLVLASRAEEIRDMVVASFIFVERERRVAAQLTEYKNARAVDVMSARMVGYATTGTMF